MKRETVFMLKTDFRKVSKGDPVVRRPKCKVDPRSKRTAKKDKWMRPALKQVRLIGTNDQEDEVFSPNQNAVLQHRISVSEESLTKRLWKAELK